MSAHAVSSRLPRERSQRGRLTGWLAACLLALLLAQQVAVLHRLGHALLLLPDAGPLAVALASPGAGATSGTSAADAADGQGTPAAEPATCLDCLAIGDLGAAPPPAWQALPPPALTLALPGWAVAPLAAATPWRVRARAPPAA